MSYENATRLFLSLTKRGESKRDGKLVAGSNVCVTDAVSGFHMTTFRPPCQLANQNAINELGSVRVLGYRGVINWTVYGVFMRKNGCSVYYLFPYNGF